MSRRCPASDNLECWARHENWGSFRPLQILSATLLTVSNTRKSLMLRSTLLTLRRTASWKAHNFSSMLRGGSYGKLQEGCKVKMISYLKYSHVSCFATVFYLSKFEYGYIGAMSFTLSSIFFMLQKRVQKQNPLLNSLITMKGNFTGEEFCFRPSVSDWYIYRAVL